jgi:drug/metabolite transporter (DMT)-like permease
MQIDFDSSSGLDKFNSSLEQGANLQSPTSKSDSWFLILSGLLMAGLIFLTWYIAQKTNYNPTVASTAVTTVAVIVIGFVTHYERAPLVVLS